MATALQEEVGTRVSRLFETANRTSSNVASAKSLLSGCRSIVKTLGETAATLTDRWIIGTVLYVKLTSARASTVRTAELKIRKIRDESEKAAATARAATICANDARAAALRWETRSTELQRELSDRAATDIESKRSYRALQERVRGLTAQVSEMAEENLKRGTALERYKLEAMELRVALQASQNRLAIANTNAQHTQSTAVQRALEASDKNIKARLQQERSRSAGVCAVLDESVESLGDIMSEVYNNNVHLDTTQMLTCLRRCVGY